jgi:hypothetical protein
MEAGLDPRSIILLVVMHVELTGRQACIGPEFVRTLQNLVYGFLVLDAS